jgi:hypothetical protein
MLNVLFGVAYELETPFSRVCEPVLVVLRNSCPLAIGSRAATGILGLLTGKPQLRL